METIKKYTKYWLLFLSSIALFMGLAFIYILHVTPTYNVTTTLLVEDDKRGDGVLKETAFSDLNMFHTTKSVDNEIQILRSKDLLHQVFQSLPLKTRYLYDTLYFGERELYGDRLPVKVTIYHLGVRAFAERKTITIINDSIFSIKTVSATKPTTYKFGQIIRTPDYNIKVDKGPGFQTGHKKIAIEFVNEKAFIDAYSNGKLQINQVVKDGNTIVLSLTDQVPQRGMDILTKLVVLYNAQNVDNMKKLAQASIEFIDGRLKYLGSDLTDVEKNVQQYKQFNMVTDLNSNTQADLLRGEDYKSDLLKIEMQLNIVEALQTYINKSDNEFSLVPSSLGIQDPTLVALTAKFNDLQQEYQRLLHNNTPGNPVVANIKDQIRSLRQNLQENLENVRKSLQLSKNNLMATARRFDNRIRTAPVVERGLLERNRETAVKENLFNYLTQKREEAGLSMTAAAPDARTVESANFDPEPKSPQKPLIYLYAFIIALAVPVSFVEGKAALTTKIKNASELNVIPNHRILGELIREKNHRTPVIDGQNSSIAIELFRYIRSNLYDMNGTGHRAIMITSTIQAEGKTFMSINLALTLARANKKVVVLEFDLRKPDLLNKLNLGNPAGINDYLDDNDMTIEDILQSSKISPNVWVVGKGKACKDPAEQFSKPRINHLITTLKTVFDYVIIDTSPVGLVADAFYLRPYTDLTIYLVRYNFTGKDKLRTIAKIFQNGKLADPVIVLNDAKPENLKEYGYVTAKYNYNLST
ncbi:GumC family protein [Mucilaginibacter panaciglaebae]|uniref:Tyrosine-protein kinase n=1 Tax=Mucilaginibacter panaciglaebae TaxID=502331 RepID=A0ABP7WF29_9SPHI